MGNTNSSSSPTGILRRTDSNNISNSNIRPEEVPLAMMAVAEKIYLKKVHILLLRYAMGKFSDDFGMIQREGFYKAMDLAKANLSNVEIFELLFTMWDNRDDGFVSYKEFCMGISPLACASEDLSVVIEFALRVSDDSNCKYIEREELYDMLTGINSTASYFGDRHLQPIDIDGIVEFVCEGQLIKTHEECATRLSINPYVKRFASGKARTNVRFKDVLVKNYIFDKEKLVTEYFVDDIEALILNDENENTNRKSGPSSREDENMTRKSGQHSRENSTHDASRSSARKQRSRPLFSKSYLPSLPKSYLPIAPSHSDEREPREDHSERCGDQRECECESETRDENSGHYGNSRNTSNNDDDCRDPPPIGKSDHRTSQNEISYSTYSRTSTPTTASLLPRPSRTPSRSSDPPSNIRYAPSLLLQYKARRNAYKLKGSFPSE